MGRGETERSTEKGGIGVGEDSRGDGAQLRSRDELLVNCVCVCVASAECVP